MFRRITCGNDGEARHDYFFVWEDGNDFDSPVDAGVVDAREGGGGAAFVFGDCEGMSIGKLLSRLEYGGWRGGGSGLEESCA